MEKTEFDIGKLKAVLEEPESSGNAFDEALRRIKSLLSMSK